MLDLLRIYHTNEEREILTDSDHRVITHHQLISFLADENNLNYKSQKNYDVLYGLSREEQRKQSCFTKIGVKMYEPTTYIALRCNPELAVCEENLILNEMVTYAAEVRGEKMPQFMTCLREKMSATVEHNRMKLEYERELQAVKDKYLPKLRELIEQSQLEQQISFRFIDLARFVAGNAQ